jgi:hypothetical protein
VCHRVDAGAAGDCGDKPDDITAWQGGGEGSGKWVGLVSGRGAAGSERRLKAPTASKAGTVAAWVSGHSRAGEVPSEGWCHRISGQANSLCSAGSEDGRAAEGSVPNSCVSVCVC